jgi:branched-chain amino acid transport system permease protein
VAVIITVIICQRLEDSRIGRAWMAIREDESPPRPWA